jgi:hypothetical protein
MFHKDVRYDSQLIEIDISENKLDALSNKILNFLFL